MEDAKKKLEELNEEYKKLEVEWMKSINKKNEIEQRMDELTIKIRNLDGSKNQNIIIDDSLSEEEIYSELDYCIKQLDVAMRKVSYLKDEIILKEYEINKYNKEIDKINKKLLSSIYVDIESLEESKMNYELIIHDYTYHILTMKEEVSEIQEKINELHKRIEIYKSKIKPPRYLTKEEFLKERENNK